MARREWPSLRCVQGHATASQQATPSASSKVELAEVDPRDDALAKGTQIPRQEGWGSLCLVASQACAAGDVLLVDANPIARAVANIDDGFCGWCAAPDHTSWQCEEFLSAYPTPITDNTSCLVEELIRCLAKGDSNCESERLARLALHTLILLADRNVERADARMQSVRSLISVFGNPVHYRAQARNVMRHDLLRRVFPDSLCDQDMFASLLYILSVFEIEEQRPPHGDADIAGSRHAVFALSSFCRHSCAPNAAQSLQNGNLVLVALESIAAGQPICLDFCGNAGLRPVKERREALYDAYGILCNCSLCTELPDRCRAFVCPCETTTLRAGLVDAENSASLEATTGILVAAVKEGMGTDKGRADHAICPVGAGSSLRLWRCIACEYSLCEPEWARCIMQERAVEARLPLSLQEADDLVRQGLIRKEHYLVIDAYFRLANNLAAQLSSSYSALGPIFFPDGLEGVAKARTKTKTSRNSSQQALLSSEAGASATASAAASAAAPASLSASSSSSSSSPSGPRTISSSQGSTPPPAPNSEDLGKMKDDTEKTLDHEGVATQIATIVNMWQGIIWSVDVAAPRAMSARVDLRLRFAELLDRLGDKAPQLSRNVYATAAELSKQVYGPRTLSPMTAWLEDQAAVAARLRG